MFTTIGVMKAKAVGISTYLRRTLIRGQDMDHELNGVEPCGKEVVGAVFTP